MFKCKCGFENPDGSVFCSNCGSRLEILCPKCNHPMTAGSKFCPECGSSLKKESVGSGSFTDNVIGGNVDNSIKTDNSSHTTYIYNTPIQEEIFCFVCGKYLSTGGAAHFACKVCGRHFCQDHMKNKLCAECEKEELLAPFEFQKTRDGYVITGLKNTSLLKITLPPFVIAIERDAFRNSSVLTAELNEGLLKIGEGAFAGCRDLFKVNIPSTVLLVGEGAFEGCTKLNTAPVSSPAVNNVARPANEDAPDVSPAMLKTYFMKARQGQTEFCFKLGYCYETGTGIDKNIAEAIYWYHKSAEKGHRPSAYRLGICYSLQNSPEKASYWYKRGGK